MPGLVGFTTQHDRDTDIRSLKAMQNLLTHHNTYVCDPFSIDHWICASASHVDDGQPDQSPFVGHGLQIWLDGEFYNRDHLCLVLACNSCTDSQLLGKLFWHNQYAENFHFLRQINGIYSAVVYDPRRKLLYLVTDRYGLRHLYWTEQDGGLAWASEYKAFLALPGFYPQIDDQTVADFFDVGYCLNDRTWFADVQVLSSGSVLVWDLQRREGQTVRYWGWDQIRPMTGRIDEAAVAEEAGRLFCRAVERCCRADERVGLQLSGGLDSRAILAAMPEQNDPIHAFTFGRTGCDDIRLASKAARVRGAVHHVIEIDAGNWLTDRFDAVWWLDGQKNLLHMHSLHVLRSALQLYDVGLNGFLGDAVIGGTYLKSRYGGLDEIELIENSGRRLTWGGLRLSWLFGKERPVFFENNFIDFVMSIPQSLRRDSYLYQQMLLARFPDYFERIAWQATGCPIAWPTAATKTIGQLRWFRHKLSRRLKRYGITLPEHSEYMDYDDWLRQEPARSTVEALLFKRKALYPAYVERKRVVQLWQEQQAGADWADQLCRHVTFELWLRQVFENEFRPKPARSY